MGSLGRNGSWGPSGSSVPSPGVPVLVSSSWLCTTFFSLQMPVCRSPSSLPPKGRPWSLRLRGQEFCVIYVGMLRVLGRRLGIAGG